MAVTNKKIIPCPVCGQEIELKEHIQFKNRLVAYHDCRPGMGLVSVYETDNPDFKPVKESEDK